MVVSVGIDVAKDKHDCLIQSSEGEVLADVFTVSNNMDGFNLLLQKIRDCNQPFGRIASAQIGMKECRQTTAFLVEFC